MRRSGSAGARLSSARRRSWRGSPARSEGRAATGAAAATGCSPRSAVVRRRPERSLGHAGHSMTVLAMAGGSRPARSQPAAVAASGTPTDREGEVEDRHVAEIAEVVVVGRREDEVGAGDAEERAEERERAGGGGGQRAADPGGGPGRGQGAKVTGALAADQSDRHREDAERQERARGRRDRHGPGAGRRFSSHLDREAGVRCERAGVGDLVARQWPAGLDEPAGRDLLPAAAAKSVGGDERRPLPGVPLTAMGCRAGAGRSSIRWTLVTATRRAPRVGMTSSSVGNAAVGEEVRARIDRVADRFRGT